MKRVLTTTALMILLATTFQNCGGLEQPSGQLVQSSKDPENDPNDIEILSSPSDVALYTGQALNLSVMAQSKAGHTLTYKWFKDSSEITGANYDTYQVASFTAANAGLYTVEISSPVDSDTLSVTVSQSANSTISITTQPQPVTVNDGQAGQLTVVASASPTQTLNYQWFKDGASYPGATSATLTLPANGPGRAGNYYVRVTSTMGPPQTVNSNTVKVTATQTFNVGTATGCVNGYCACVTPGQLNVGYRPSALAICMFKGYTDVTNFTVMAGPQNVNHCSADGLGCFQNHNSGNVVCSNVSCTK